MNDFLKRKNALDKGGVVVSDTRVMQRRQLGRGFVICCGF